MDNAEALPKPEDALEYLTSRIIPGTTAESAGNIRRAIDSLRAHLTDPGYVRVPDGWIDFVRDVVESAEGYESRSGNKVNGDWVARGRALLASATGDTQ